jgi:hypothetical protein
MMREALHGSLPELLPGSPPDRQSGDDEHRLVSAVGESRDLVMVVP